MKLDENDRDSQTRLMKVKDMMLEEERLKEIEKNREKMEEFERKIKS